jgi:exonuclease SbcD
MKLLHTADWHLGKRLDHFSRLEEQKAVMAEICEIADREAVDAVLIAGDLFDHINPSIEAIELFYHTLKKLANDGRRPVIGIAGNHDSPDRIEAPDPLARECGIILAGYPNSQITPFKLETGLTVTQSESGFLEIQLPENKELLRILITPYANEIRLKRFLGREDPEENMRQILEEKWQKIADKYCDDQGVNILMTHLFAVNKPGDSAVEPDDEKPILTVGGAQEVYSSNFPKDIQYVALGHLHRPYFVSQNPYPIAYSGSPLAYSMSEAGQEKSVNIITAEPGKPVSVEPVQLDPKGKKLVRKKFEHIENALNWLEENQEVLVELTIVSDHFLTSEDRKKLYECHEGIVTIIPDIRNKITEEYDKFDIDLQKDIKDLFADYFQYKHNQAPNERIMSLLQEVLAEDEETH